MRYTLYRDITTIHSCPRGMDGYYAWHILRESGAEYVYLDTDARYIRIVHDNARVLHVSYKHTTMRALYYAITTATVGPDVYNTIRVHSRYNKTMSRVADNSYRVLGNQASSIVCYIAGIHCYNNAACYYSPSLQRYKIISDNGLIIAQGHITLYKGFAGI